MRNRRMLKTLRCTCGGVLTVATVAMANAEDPGAATPQTEPREHVVPEVRGDSVDTLQHLLSPLPDNVEFTAWTVVAGDDEAAATNATASTADGRLVYSNTLGRHLFGPGLGFPPGPLIADDIAIVGIGGCSLNKYTTIVSGDKNGDGSGVGPFGVDIALYETCPHATVGMLSAPIPGTEAHFDLPDNGLHEITVIPSATVELPGSFYLGVSFSRPYCGIVVGAPATLGHSADLFDFPGLLCEAFLGGYPGFAHASFYAEIHVLDKCPDAFLGYRNSMQAGAYFTPGARVRFAEDIQLAVPDCGMVAYEVAARENGIIRFDLRTVLSDVSPRYGGLIPGTTQGFLAFGAGVHIARFEFDPPIPLPPNLWMTFETTSSVAGPIVTGRQADFGSTEDVYAYYDEASWQWITEPFPGPTHGAFDITIWCEGELPPGACCDTVNRDDQGEAVCRELPAMNCPFNRWIKGEVCDPDLFYPVCGISACCLPDDSCQDLTENQCAALDGIYQREQFCDVDGQACPFYACTLREGECCARRGAGETGCADPFCCGDVCTQDRFCCRIEWDQQCADAATQICPQCWPRNDECEDGSGALLIEIPSSTYGNGLAATENPSDPGFICHSEEPNAQGYGTLWYKFVATETSAQLSTCGSDPPAYDTLLRVFASGGSCINLEPIACSDDVPRCASSNANAQLCVFNLVPGETYYVMVAAKSEETEGMYRLDITSPCSLDIPPLHNDGCKNAEELGGIGPIAWYDLSGQSLNEQPATRDEPIDDWLDPNVPDAWFDWTAPCHGEVTIETCPLGEWTPPFTVYEGCNCPVDAGTLVDMGEPEPGNCGADSERRFNATKGQCYKFRLGSRPQPDDRYVGEMRINVRCFTCPPGDVVFFDPPSGVVDARNPFPGSDTSYWTGIDTFGVQAPPGADSPECWSLCVGSYYGSHNRVDEVIDHGDGTYSIRTDQVITPGAVTSLSYTDDDDGGRTTGLFWYHPGNVNADLHTNMFDLPALIDVLNGAGTAPYGTHSTDCDHSGRFTPSDILCLIDLLNYPRQLSFGPWNGTRQPNGDPNDSHNYCPALMCGGRHDWPCTGGFCKFVEGRCAVVDDVGVCTPTPTQCPQLGDPVCGCDGETYLNECLAEQGQVSIDHHGKCVTD